MSIYDTPSGVTCCEFIHLKRGYNVLQCSSIIRVGFLSPDFRPYNPVITRYGNYDDRRIYALWACVVEVISEFDIMRVPQPGTYDVPKLKEHDTE